MFEIEFIKEHEAAHILIFISCNVEIIICVQKQIDIIVINMHLFLKELTKRITA